MTLQNRAWLIDQDAIIAQRLKRLSSLEAKLRRLRRLKLSDVQDIGGCRAVVHNTKQVWELVKVYEAGRAKNPHKGPALLWVKDYITQPKASGYRSYHLVYQYRTDSDSRNLRCFNGHRIEIQLRSRLQHAWATAVETVDAFTHQALKSNLGTESWRRFFALMGSVVAFREKTALVPATPTERAALAEELREIEQTIQARSVLRGLAVVPSFLGTTLPRDADLFLLKLDTVERTLDVMPYFREDAPEASERYLAVEKEISGNPAVQAVLVSVDKLGHLKKAYPNYYVDLDLFLRTLDEALGHPATSS